MLSPRLDTAARSCKKTDDDQRGEIARFRSRRSSGPPSAPSDPGRCVARILGCPDAVAVRGNRLSPSEVETTETAASDFFGGAAAPSGLRLPPPSLGSWKTRKNTQTTINLQEATCGGHPGSAGVSEVTPYARIRNLVAWRRRGTKNCRLPLFWVKKRPKRTQTTINR